MSARVLGTLVCGLNVHSGGRGPRPLCRPPVPLIWSQPLKSREALSLKGTGTVKSWRGDCKAGRGEGRPDTHAVSAVRGERRLCMGMRHDSRATATLPRHTSAIMRKCITLCSGGSPWGCA